MSEPLTIARDYVELYEREHADPAVDRYTLAGLEDDIAMARYIVERHGKHERLLMVLRDLALQLENLTDPHAHSVGVALRKLATP